MPQNFLEKQEILSFLQKRSNVLGGVVITGGEPLIHEGTIDLINEIRRLGLAVKIDTNGSFPDRLKTANADYIAMDIKTAFSRYSTVLPAKADEKAVVEAVHRSIEYILTSGTPHQFRTTMVPGIVSPDDFVEILPAVQGAHSYLISGFRNGTTLDPQYSDTIPYSDKILKETGDLVRANGIPVLVRTNRTA